MLYLSLGTNLGDRHANLQKATELIHLHIGNVVAQATPIETQPVGFTSENAFLNSALAVETTLTPQEILEETQAIEREMGRTQKSQDGVYHDRIIDIDILLYGDLVIQSDTLTIPHPWIYDRLFVLEPLAGIASHLKLPLYNQTVGELLAARKRCYIKPLMAEMCTKEMTDRINALLDQLSPNHKPITTSALQALCQENNPDSTIYLLFTSTSHLPIAMATLSVCHLLTGTKAWIEDVVVDENYRSQGFAHILLHHLIYQAHCADADTINLTSRPTRVAANKLYQSMGFEMRKTNVYKKTL